MKKYAASTAASTPTASGSTAASSTAAPSTVAPTPSPRCDIDSKNYATGGTAFASSFLPTNEAINGFSGKLFFISNIDVKLQDANCLPYPYPKPKYQSRFDMYAPMGQI